ncbi:MAG: translation initiation factor IF-2 N-terminal domain-containing protein [Desulfobacterales bacterium]|nr:translation initiation factor IF-2 N-terminal domain-containing protein [Desulfobacterales bacterium]
MAKIRVYELARDLNLKNQQLIEFILKETDVKIRHFPY